MWVLGGYAAYMACQWGMIVILARWGSAEKVGQFALALATTAPIILFTNLGLRRVYATDAKSAFRFSDYLGLRLLTNVIGLGMIGLVAWISGQAAAMVLVILAMGLAKAVEATSDILHGYFQKRRRIDIGARSTLLRGPLALAGLAAGFYFTKDVLLAILGMGAAWMAVVLLYDWPRAARLRRQETEDKSGSPGPRAWGSLARLAMPLGLVALLTSLRASIPSFVIAAHWGERSVGLFAALAYFHAASNRVVSALGEAATTPLAAHYASGDRASFLRLLGTILLVSLAISLAGLWIAILAGRTLLGAFYGADYATESAVLVALMAAAAAANLQTVFDYAMTATRHLKIQPFLYGGGALLLFLLCGALVPSGGLRGAAYALGIGSVVEMIASAVVVGWAVARLRNRRHEPVLEGS
jgi:O-antigen/teichoic acid export membrane protein